MESYEKKYKEALAKAREILRFYDCNPAYKDVGFYAKSDFACVFPELKESEDERIRKELMDFIYVTCFPVKDLKKKERFLAWLEKQESVGEIVSRCRASWYNEGKIQGQIEGLSDEEKYQQGWHDALEKQGEQKLAWSEEDERICHFIISDIANDKAICKYELSKGVCDEQINWLKSLKERVGCEVNCTTKWKPSEADILLLERIANGKSNPQDFQASLGCLIWQLKKLREE